MENAFVVPQIALKTILYATDFSQFSDAALPSALSLARKYRSKIFAVHVISLTPFSGSSPTQASRALAAQALREAGEAMDRLERQCKDVPHEMLIRKGEIWDELSGIVKDKSIDVIVCGTHGRTGVSKIIMGSIAEKIYRHAPCPVLTVGPRVAGEAESLGDIHAILFPTDFTPESISAAPYAVSLAVENQARLYLLHVAQSPVSRLIEHDLVTRLLNLVPQNVQLSCSPKAFVEFGEPGPKITDLAEELMVDLIVLGPKRLPMAPASHHLPTATAQYVVSRAVCPVLTASSKLGAAHILGASAPK